MDYEARDRVAQRAFTRLIETLETHGNRPNEQHRAALHALVESMAEMALLLREGRYAIGLPTSMGKSTAVLCLMEALDFYGFAGQGVIVAAQKVETLCEHVRALVRLGVDRSKIALVHSYQNAASEPADADHTSRPFLFLTHAKVSGGFARLEPYLSWEGGRRAVMFYDESLVRSDAVGLRLPEVERGVDDVRACLAKGAVQPRYRAALKEASAFLTDALARVEAAQAEAAASGQPAFATLPSVPAEREGRLRTALVNARALDAVRRLLDLQGTKVRVIATETGGVLQYRQLVPDELTNILVLDASYPVRGLTKLDPTLCDAERQIDAFRKLGFSTTETKRWDRVTFYRMHSGGGRSSMLPAFMRPKEERWVTAEVVKLVKSRPASESWVFFTYLKRPHEPVEMAEVLRRDLMAAGIDLGATVPVKVRDTASGEEREVQRPRFSFLTWGQHDSTNAYAHAANVVMLGVLQLDRVQLAATALGQKDDLGGDVSPAFISYLATGESTHRIYQAASRGASRTVVDGQAAESRIWFIHLDRDVERMLRKYVCPGARFEEWKADRPTRGKVAAAKEAILRVLSEQPETVERVQKRDVIRRAGLAGASERTVRRALTEATGGGAWVARHHFLVRAAAAYGFRTSPPG